MIDRRLADLVVAAHFAYLAFLPAGAMLVTRHSRLAPLHLGAVAVAVTSVTAGFDCPLTTWEQTLRRRGGQHAYPGGFINHYLTGTAFPRGLDRVAQAAVAVLIAAAYVRLARRRADAPDSVEADGHASPADAALEWEGQGSEGWAPPRNSGVLGSHVRELGELLWEGEPDLGRGPVAVLGHDDLRGALVGRVSVVGVVSKTSESARSSFLLAAGGGFGLLATILWSDRRRR